MKNYGIRSYKYGFSWIPKYVTLDEFLRADILTGVYGCGYHDFVPKEYAVGIKIGVKI